ncbi:unnamed protein product [Lampetra fluviatilis]
MAAAAATTAAPALGGAALLHRSVERALEDACLSGVLNLSGRKLKDFPRSTASFDLSDVTEAGTGPCLIARNIVMGTAVDRAADIPNDR